MPPALYQLSGQESGSPSAKQPMTWVMCRCSKEKAGCRDNGRRTMRLFFPFMLCCSGLLMGCSYFGYYKYERPVWASPAEAAKVAFPDSHEGAVQLTGAMLKALEVAM